MAEEARYNFCVGSEWLYYKIYTGHKTADLVLTEIFKPISEQLMQEGIIDKWFFIRYGDPKHHLRIRFHCTDKIGVGKIIARYYDPLSQFLEQDLIWKIQLDTYNREIERYGQNTMELSETLFCYDSAIVVQFLDIIEGDEGEELRWLFGLRAIDHLLNCFMYLLEEKLVLMEGLKTGFGKEFGMSRPLKKQLDDKYRKKRSIIEQFMTFTKESHPDYELILEILKINGEKMKPIAQQILYFRNKEQLHVNFNDLMSSYIHMLMNRLFKSKNRLNEMVCYDFLYRYYKSIYARKKISTK
ncbi:thiopeptide-type bacteriocin biosynthesis protein [Spongiimicrobium salis]|uniref:thiopeptide-type bacteriocin biosynthesis protein n=1 Tax=Spongiimicrobium salis TaxID=1667022 RepID=UPI00374D30C9